MVLVPKLAMKALARDRRGLAAARHGVAMAGQAVGDIGVAPGIHLGGIEGAGGLTEAGGGPKRDGGGGGERGGGNRGLLSREFHGFLSIIRRLVSGLSGWVLPCSTLCGMSYCGRNQWPCCGTSWPTVSWAIRIQPHRLPAGAGAFGAVDLDIELAGTQRLLLLGGERDIAGDGAGRVLARR